MIGTQWMKDSLAARREARDMTKAGWEWVGEGGGKLWELYRGWRTDQHIMDAKVSYNRMGVWVKVEPRSSVVPGSGR